LEVVRYLIEEEKVDVHCKKFGFPAVCWAASSGRQQVIKYLVSVGANVNTQDKPHGWNALHRAVLFGQLETVQLLISLGCDFNAKDNDGLTPIQLAQEQGTKEIVEFLKLVEQK
jgi:ankyrin repeat protein